MKVNVDETREHDIVLLSVENLMNVLPTLMYLSSNLLNRLLRTIKGKMAEPSLLYPSVAPFLLLYRAVILRL
ncbi:hypothetical protein SERLADRAFT_378331, partial [Serpula lacrymans var. lacrymans S7.9]